jgi:hypothetical protein
MDPVSEILITRLNIPSKVYTMMVFNSLSFDDAWQSFHNKHLVLQAYLGKGPDCKPLYPHTQAQYGMPHYPKKPVINTRVKF